MQVLWRCLAEGGQMWLQSDWLVNLAAGPVRRGPFGAALLWVADGTGLSPLPMVIGLQAVLATALCLCAVILLHRQSHGVMALAVFSAGFFAVLWLNDPLAGFRKEMLPLLAIGLVSIPQAGLVRAGLSALVLMAGAWGHELALLLAPAWALALYLVPNRLPRRQAAALALVAGVAVLFAGVYALRHPRVEDAAAICAAVTLRGAVHPAFCNGAIRWLALPDNATGAVRIALGASPLVWLLPLAVAAAFAPILWLVRAARVSLLDQGLLVLAVLPVLLLFPVGLDWGRWVSLQVTVLGFVVLGMGASGRLAPPPLPRAGVMLVWLALALLTGLRSMTEVIPGALLQRVLSGYSL